MRTELTNNNKPMMKHKIAITYSTCCKQYGLIVQNLNI